MAFSLLGAARQAPVLSAAYLSHHICAKACDHNGCIRVQISNKQGSLNRFNIAYMCS